MRRRLNRRLEEIDAEYYAKLSKESGVAYEQIEDEYRREHWDRLKYLWLNETDKLLEQAKHYDLECSNRDWYVERDDAEGFEILTASAQRELRRLIKQEKRANIEWWVRTIIPIITVLVALAGILLALLSFLAHSSR